MVLATPSIDQYLDNLKQILVDTKTDEELFEAIVNAPFGDKRLTTLFGLGFLAFLLVNKQEGMIDRIAISETDTAQGAISVTVKPFQAIKIPIDNRSNFIAEAIRSRRYQQTSDWNYLLGPDLSPEEARINQAGSGIAYSFVYPLTDARDGGAIIFHYFITLDKIEEVQRDFMFRYTKLVSEILNNRS